MSYKEDMKRISQQIQKMKALNNPLQLKENIKKITVAIDELYKNHATALYEDEFSSPELKQKEHSDFKAKFNELHHKFYDFLGGMQNIQFFNSLKYHAPEVPCANMDDAAASLNVNRAASSSDLADSLVVKSEPTLLNNSSSNQ